LSLARLTIATYHQAMPKIFLQDQIHGFQMPPLLLKALVWGGYIELKGEGYLRRTWVISEEIWSWNTKEMEKAINNYLQRKDD